MVSTGWMRPKRPCKLGLKHDSGGWQLPFQLLLVALAQGDQATAEQARTQLRANAQGKITLLTAEGRLAASHGKLKDARAHYADAQQAALSADLKETAANFASEEASLEAVCQNRAQAAQAAAAALALSNSFVIRMGAASAYALAGIESKARTLNDALLRERPNDFYVQKVYGPAVQAEIELNRGNAARAADRWRSVESFVATDTLALYLHAMIELRAGQAQVALQQFERIRSLHNLRPADPYISLARLGQARAYAGLGDKGKSREAYQDFFALWKDGDPDVPILKQAIAEYEKVK